jgi:hypothetical protein
MNSSDIKSAHKLLKQRDYIAQCVARLRVTGGSIHVKSAINGSHTTSEVFDIPIDLEIILDALNDKHMAITNEMEDMGVVFRTEPAPGINI